jgi:hypothetical protein
MQRVAKGKTNWLSPEIDYSFKNQNAANDVALLVEEVPGSLDMN